MGPAGKVSLYRGQCNRAALFSERRSIDSNCSPPSNHTGSVEKGELIQGPLQISYLPCVPFRCVNIDHPKVSFYGE